ncbi:hypothetical protein B9G55_00900 [Saccharibacillus sp. O16]|nr:hypothetical protein B9G55_00900 [Saccharibacillus sp. O16]
MAQLFEWVTSNFFVVMIIVGALVSVFGRKGNTKPNGGGEPFGGRGASASGNPARRPLPNRDGQRQSPFSGAPAQQANAGEQRGALAERKNPGQVSRQMNAEIDKRLREQRSQQRRAHSVENAAKAIERAAGGGIAGAVSNQAVSSPAKPTVRSTAAPGRPAASLIQASSADELRKGLLWAEILGAPRARKPYSSGRR